MTSIDKKWMLFGAIAIAVVSSLLFTVSIMNPLVPTPFYLLILAWIISYGIIAVLPLIYLAEYWFLSRKNGFGKITLISAVLLSILSFIYFWVAWEYGLKYQGELHTQLVAAENGIGFLILLTVAYKGVKANSKPIQYSANLFMFLLLAWCAFPYLGELP
ncbi:MAG: hypothetical protein HY881_03240 [Deltaproteobacteria bacterium]|nr:hypothetical protein [Deltaproteobacteria bacterium]